MSIHFLYYKCIFIKIYLCTKTFFFYIYEHFFLKDSFPPQLHNKLLESRFFFTRNLWGAEQHTGSGCVEAFKGHTDAVQVLWYMFESHLVEESSIGLVWKKK